MLDKLTLIILSSLLAISGAVAQTFPNPVKQTTPAPTETAPSPLSPAAAYREAMRPVEITRASVANWSEIEQASLGVAIKQASVACAGRNPNDFSGSPLVDLSRLCALGFTWPATVTAANRYIHEDATPKPRLAEAYAALINADLQLKDEHSAFTDAQAMLTAVPYTSVVAEATTQAIAYMHLLFTLDAVTLAEKRQPMVLADLHPGPAPLESAPVPVAPVPVASDAIPSVSDLYKQGLALAELQQLQAAPEDARQTIAALEAALPATIATDDLMAIARMRQRYAQLGKPLAPITPLASLAAPSRKLKLPARHNIAVLLLFPDWCAQCVRMARQVPLEVFAVNGHDANMVGLLAQTVPPQKPPKVADKNAAEKNAQGQNEAFNPAYVAESLKGSATLTVPPSLLDTFDATDLPLLIFTDSEGIVRLFEAGNESALQPGDTVDSAVALIGENWPASQK